MDQLGFPPDDKLRGLVSTASDKLHVHTVELHYMSCKGGAGRHLSGDKAELQALVHEGFQPLDADFLLSSQRTGKMVLVRT